MSLVYCEYNQESSCQSFWLIGVANNSKQYPLLWSKILVSEFEEEKLLQNPCYRCGLRMCPYP